MAGYRTDYVLMDTIAIDLNGILNNKESNVISSITVMNMIILLQTVASYPCLNPRHQTVSYIAVIFLNL